MFIYEDKVHKTGDYKRYLKSAMVVNLSSS